MKKSEPAATPPNSTQESPGALPLFRPEVSGERSYGDVLAFRSPTWKQSASLAVAALCLASLFMAFAEFNRIEYVRGVVAPSTGVSRISAPRNGIIASIGARQGDFVRVGQPLVAISSSSIVGSGRNASQEKLSAFRREQALGEETIREEAARSQAEESRFQAQIGRLEREQVLLQSQIGLQRQRIDRNEMRLRNLNELRTRGHVSLVTVQEQEEEILTLRQQLAELQQRHSAALYEVQQLQSQLLVTRSDARRLRLQSEAALAEVGRGATQAEEDARTIVGTVVAGRLASLHVEMGQSVSSGQEIGSVIPHRAKATVHLFVPSSMIGLVRKGQSVILRYDSYPYQRYGSGRGIITSIAQTSLPPVVEAPGTEQATTYRATVAILPDSHGFDLRPDMSLTGGIVVEHRSLLDWLLGPLRRRLEDRVA